MNGASGTPNAGTPNAGSGGGRFAQKLVSQEPVYDRKIKVHRPRKKRGRGNGPHYL